MTAFQASREDGRSDSRVVFEFVANAEPGTLFDFDSIRHELEEGSDAVFSNNRVSDAVRRTNKTLLKERKRYLESVRGRGYRVIRAEEHLAVALNRKSRADAQIQAGIALLKNAKVEELSESQRSLHFGQLIILDRLHQIGQESTKRLAEHDQVLAEMRAQQTEIKERIQRLEGESDAA